MALHAPELFGGTQYPKRRYTNEDYGYPPDRPLSELQRTVPPEMVVKMSRRIEELFHDRSRGNAMRPENV
jgi:hypothetical protein